MRLATLALTLFSALLLGSLQSQAQPASVRELAREGFFFKAPEGWTQVDHKSPRPGEIALYHHDGVDLTVAEVANDNHPAEDVAKDLEDGFKSAPEYRRESLEFKSSLRRKESFELTVSWKDLASGKRITHIFTYVQQPAKCWFFVYELPSDRADELKPAIEAAKKAVRVLDLGRENPVQLFDGMLYAMQNDEWFQYALCFDVDAMLDGMTEGKFMSLSDTGKDEARKKVFTNLDRGFRSGAKKQVELGMEVHDLKVDNSGTAGTATLVQKNADGSTTSNDLEFEKGELGWRISKIGKSVRHEKETAETTAK